MNSYETSEFTPFDLLAIQREARAMRDAHVANLVGSVWKRLKIALAHAGAQPQKAESAARA